VVEVGEEVVGEELLSGAELAARSVGWGNNQSELPLVWHSWWKTAAGKSCGPTSLAGAVGMLLALEGRKEEALLLAQSDSLGRLVRDGQSSDRHGAEQSAVRLSREGKK
jgi:hypothetical protein